MKKRLISVILSAVLMLGIIPVFQASAFMLGDIDGDGNVSAKDARLALRASVGLETLTAEELRAADVNGDEGISAADARLILRASVGLETLHTHSYTSTVTKNATCTENGETEKVCECGEIIKETIPATGHLLKGLKIEKEATEEEYGEAVLQCVACDYEERYTLCTHQFNSIKMAETTSCSVKGCKGQLPSFNCLVNSLKGHGTLNRFSGFGKYTSTTEKAKAEYSNILFLALAKGFQEMLNSEIKAGTETEYSEFTKNRHVNNSTFFVNGKPYVSDLNDNDVKSVTLSNVNKIDFINKLPDTYTATASGRVIDLEEIKESASGSFIKVKVTLNPETFSTDSHPTGVTPIEKIFNAEYNEEMQENFNSIEGAFAEDDTLADFLSMKTSVTTGCSVEYYFDSATLKPVCAYYITDMSTNAMTYIYVNNDGEKQKTPTVTITIKASNLQENYFFFN